MKYRALVYGKNGQFARCLQMHGEREGFEIANFGRPEIQIDDLGAIEIAIESFSPDIIINASAYNNVDGAETDFDEAMRINAIGPRNLAIGAKNAAIPIIHVSTDYVFDGENNGLYDEKMAPNPINLYGKSKLAGEIGVALANPDHAILRTAWVFSEFGNNFVKSILRVAKDGRKNMDMVIDQWGIPTSAHDLARAALIIAKNLIENPENKELRGVFHCSSLGIINRFQYAQAVFELAKAKGMNYCELNGIQSAQYVTAAKRPKRTGLECSAITKIHNVEIRDWQIALNEIFDEIAKSI